MGQKVPDPPTINSLPLKDSPPPKIFKKKLNPRTFLMYKFSSTPKFRGLVHTLVAL